MKTICIIGLGTISRNHHYGLVNNSNFKLTGACDIKDDADGRGDYCGVPFYNDYIEMISQLGPDYVVVALPPKLHAPVAIEVLGMGCSVLIEKPTALSVEEVEKIEAAARKNELYFETAFHWQYGYEALYAAENVGRYGKIKKVSVSIDDPYSSDGIHIDQGKLGLCGTFLDAGSNAISFLYSILDFDRFELIDADYTYDPDAGLPVCSNHVFRHNGIVAEVKVDWRNKLNKKITRIVFEDGKEMVVDHSRQSVSYEGELIYRNDELDRLTAHYYNYYNLFEATDERARKLYSIAMKITGIWEEREYEK